MEAKPDDCNSCAVGNVAICTERVEAKYFSDVGAETLTTLQSARSVWRQSLQQYRTMRVGGSCNLHGACGGKVLKTLMRGLTHWVAICTERVEAKTATII